MRFHFLWIVFGLPFSLFSQLYENFELEQFQESIFISWTMTTGSTCNGIEIQRSSDSINFVKIHEIQGVCGSSTKKVHYNFTDYEAQKNQKYFYRLKLGTQGVSEIKSISFFTTLGKSVLIYPNPVKSIINIILQEDNFNEMMIVSLSGKLLYKEEITNQKIIQYPIDLPKGVYLFQFVDNTEIITSKVIVN